MLSVSVARLARASLQQKNIRANVDTLAIKPREVGTSYSGARTNIPRVRQDYSLLERTEITVVWLQP
jgi:hypothetical protein